MNWKIFLKKERKANCVFNFDGSRTHYTLCLKRMLYPNELRCNTIDYYSFLIFTSIGISHPNTLISFRPSASFWEINPEYWTIKVYWWRELDLNQQFTVYETICLTFEVTKPITTVPRESLT